MQKDSLISTSEWKTKTAWQCYRDGLVDEVDQVIIKMERNGFKIDPDYCARQADEARKDEAELLAQLKNDLVHFGIHDPWDDPFADEDEKDNPDDIWASPKKLVDVLHNKLRLEPSPVWKKGRVRLAQGERKTDEDALKWIRDHSDGRFYHFVDAILSLRRVRSCIKYLTKLPNYIAPDGLVHPVSGPAGDYDDRAGTITWRLVAKNPEVMQIPGLDKDPYKIRRAFVAPPGYKLLAADEKALETVILAHFLIEVFNDHQLAEMVSPGAPDFHSRNAKSVFGTILGWSDDKGKPIIDYPLDAFQDDGHPFLQKLRRDIKAVWYGLVYNKTIWGFATSLRDSRGEPVGEKVAGGIINGIFTAIPALPRYQAWTREYTIKHGGIPGLGGAWCDVSDLLATKTQYAINRACRITQNFGCQEGGARIIGKAMVDCDRDETLTNAGVVLERQIHDELNWRIPTNVDWGPIKGAINTHMTSYPLRAKLQVSFGEGETWDEC